MLMTHSSDKPMAAATLSKSCENVFGFARRDGRKIEIVSLLLLKSVAFANPPLVLQPVAHSMALLSCRFSYRVSPAAARKSGRFPGRMSHYCRWWRRNLNLNFSCDKI
jgi:hypothetical protein